MRIFHIIWTIVLFAIFLAIVFWAWNGKRKQRFDEAARLPLEDDSTSDIPRQEGLDD
ncbi:MAG: cbb3-type cytochrome c oxidase subunit 3 [Gammaproteobacteria bacterium]|nr:cbb3-type cytochrome c oxidase subunit 3 [Gammaproteobacteria bacterium]